MQGVLLEMELAALPWHASETCFQSGAQALVIVADDEEDAVEAALLQRAKEVAPVNLGFAQRGADAQDRAPAVLVNAVTTRTAQSSTTPSRRTFS
jgi:hypothetical protein